MCAVDTKHMTRDGASERLSEAVKYALRQKDLETVFP